MSSNRQNQPGRWKKSNINIFDIFQKEVIHEKIKQLYIFIQNCSAYFNKCILLFIISQLPKFTKF
jgi:hypothetical protein